MVGQPDGEKTLTVTDGQTDILRRHSPRYAPRRAVKMHGISEIASESSVTQAQLSQRDRASLRVIEYFAKVTQDHLRSFEMTLLSRTCVSP